MNVVHLGSSYGGWTIDLDSIKNGDVIIDAGLGEDISFLEELSNHRLVHIKGVDPTPKSHRYITTRNLDNFEIIKKAIAPFGISSVKMFKNANPNHVSESAFDDHTSVYGESYSCEAMSFKDIIKTHNPALVKMDIEGMEYEVYKECLGVNQICIEFHHHCMKSKTLDDTRAVIQEMGEHGYKVISNNNDHEVTFLLERNNVQFFPH